MTTEIKIDSFYANREGMAIDIQLKVITCHDANEETYHHPLKIIS